MDKVKALCAEIRRLIAVGNLPATDAPWHADDTCRPDLWEAYLDEAGIADWVTRLEAILARTDWVRAQKMRRYTGQTGVGAVTRQGIVAACAGAGPSIHPGPLWLSDEDRQVLRQHGVTA